MSLPFANPLEKLSDNAESSFDLESLFSHPAGLRTARHIVGTIIRASRDNGSSQAHSTFSSVSPQIFGTTPTVSDRLREILAFSDTKNDNTHYIERPDSSGIVGNLQSLRRSDGSRLPPSQEQSSSSSTTYYNPTQLYHQPYSESFRNSQTISHPSGRLQGAGSYQKQAMYPTSDGRASMQARSTARPQPHQSSSAMDVDSLFANVRSSSHGTESPYHVESPSGQLAFTPSSNRSSQESSELLPNPEMDPFQLDRHSPSIQSTSRQVISRQRPLQPYLPNAGPSAYSQFHPTTARSTMSAPPNNMTDTSPRGATIKGFLPVNKTVDSTSTSSTKQYSLSHAVSTGGLGSQTRIGSHLSKAPLQYTNEPSSINASTIPSASSNCNSSTIDIVDSASQLLLRKRKNKQDGSLVPKKRKTDEGGKIETHKRAKKQDDKADRPKLNPDLWIRIFEYSPPSFIKKARLVCKEWKGILDNLHGIYANQRHENFGFDMPPAPIGVTERQYNNLLGGKGCLEPGCPDKKTSRTHWSWAQRWCSTCWKSKIEREDRVLKHRQNDMGRTIVTKLLECIPVGMHDSFMKPHDYIEDIESRPRGAPRLYRYYLVKDVDKIIEEYNSLTPVMGAAETDEERAAAQATFQDEMAKLDQKRADFLAERKEKNIIHMQTVQKIESGVKMRREKNRDPYTANRTARKQLFSLRASEELPHISLEFVQNSAPFKAACRIFRDGGTERGWQQLKPKIEKFWEESQSTGPDNMHNMDSEGTPDVSTPERISGKEADGMRLASHVNDNGQQVHNTSAASVNMHLHRSQMLARQNGLPGPSAMYSASQMGMSNGHGMPTLNRQPAHHLNAIAYANHLSNLNSTNFHSGGSSIFAQSYTTAHSNLARAANNLSASFPSASGNRIPVSSLLINSNPPPNSNYNPFA